MEGSELVDIVNRDDEIIGVKPRAQVGADEITRASACFLVDERGNVLIAQRDGAKKHNPLIWSVAVAETVQSGEDYLAAIIRGAYEEIRLSAGSDNLVAGEKTFYPHNNVFRQTYFMVCTEEQKVSLVPRKGEVEAIKWVPLDELKNMLTETPTIFSRSLPEIVPYRERYKQDIIAVLEARNS